jgi:hypothetical protein
MEEIRAFYLENKVLPFAYFKIKSESGVSVKSKLLRKGKSDMIELNLVEENFKDGETVWLELYSFNISQNLPNDNNGKPLGSIGRIPSNLTRRVSSKKFIYRSDSPYRANYEVIRRIFRAPKKPILPLPTRLTYSLSFVGLGAFFDEPEGEERLAAQIDGIYYILSVCDENHTIERHAMVTVNPSDYKGEINIPEYVEFEGNKYLVNSIYASAFDDSRELTKVTIAKTVEYIGFAAFAHTGLTSVEIPEGVTWINGCLLADCLNLQSVTIPSRVEEISDFAFDNCIILRKIVIIRTTPPSLHEDAFDGVDKSKITIYIPKGSMKYYQNSTWKDFKLVEE